jgi:nitroreductase
MISAIKNRRSHREFLDQPIPENKIKEVINAGLAAPSANAKYPWEIVVTKDEELKKLLAKTTPWSTFAEKAEVIITVVGNEAESPFWIEDCSIVAEHLWLEATEQELGACWIQIRNQGGAEASVKEILNIPEKLRVLCLIAIGVPAEKTEATEEKDLAREKVKYETYK